MSSFFCLIWHNFEHFLLPIGQLLSSANTYVYFYPPSFPKVCCPDQDTPTYGEEKGSFTFSSTSIRTTFQRLYPPHPTDSQLTFYSNPGLFHMPCNVFNM